MRAKTVQEFINESEELEDEKFVGDKTAIAQGLEPLTKSQLAACYLNAKNAIGRSEDANTTFAGKIARKMNKPEKETDFQRVTAPRLADMLDRSVRTIGYTISKFRLLLDGNREGTLSNVMYRKILYYFDLFQKMSPGEVHGLALEAIDPDASYERSEEFKEQTSEQSKKALEKKKEAEKSKFNLINELTNSFVQYKPLGEQRAAKAALKFIETKYNMTREELIQLIKTSKIEPSLRKIFLAI